MGFLSATFSPKPHLREVRLTAEDLSHEYRKLDLGG